MNRSIIALTLVLATTLSLQGRAQEVPGQELEAARQRLDEAARELAELQRRKGPPPGFDVHRLPLPMKIGLFFGRPTEKGLEVMGVTPDGPAAEAGLVAGDVITAIDGQGVGRRGMGAMREIHRQVAERQPGEYVAIDYLRDESAYTAQVLIRAPEQTYQAFGFVDATQSAAGVAPAFAVSGATISARPAGVMLHDLKPGLGRYFGTETGVLVLTGADAPEGLMPGDVVIDVDGEPVAGQGELFAALAGTTRPVTVLRDGGTLVLEVSPQDLTGHFTRRVDAPAHGRALRIIEMRNGDHTGDVIFDGELDGEGL